MQVYHGIESFKPLQKAVVTSGSFDGVHFGHQRILDHIKDFARKDDAETVLITFWPHPKFVLSPDSAHSLKLLSTLDEKIELLDSFGLDHLIIFQFNREFAQTSSMDFIQKYLINGIHTTRLVIGYDHHFGRNREGSFEYLQKHQEEFGFHLNEIPAQVIEENAVSSTKIREALDQGEIAKANKYLGYEYSLRGVVVKGNQLGRTIDFPTANIQVKEEYKLIPATGVYAIKAIVAGKEYGGMLNIGTKPTITHEQKMTIEANLFNFNQEIYGKNIRIIFVKRLRDEKKFNGINELKNQLFIDKTHATEAIQAIK